MRSTVDPIAPLLSTPMAHDPYYTMAQIGLYAAKIGAALITMVEPQVGHHAEYNR